MKDRILQVVNTVLEDPAVEGLNANTGAGGWGGGGTNAGSMFITLKPLEERKMNSDQVIARLRPNSRKYPGQPLSAVGAGSSHWRPVERSAVSVHAAKRQRKGSERVGAASIPKIENLNPDRRRQHRPAGQGITGVSGGGPADGRAFRDHQQMIDDTLYDAFGQRQVSTMYTQLNQYHVVMEVDQQFWQNPEGLRYIYVEAPNNKQVPLSAVTHYQSDTAPHRRFPLEECSVRDGSHRCPSGRRCA